MDTLLNHTGIIKDIFAETVDLNEPFLEVAARFSRIPGTILLASGGDLDCAKHHILAIKPWLAFSGRKNQFNISTDNQVVDVYEQPFEVLRFLLDTYRLDSLVHSDKQLPVYAGLFGYLSYDLKDYLEELPRTSVDDLLLPHICLYAPSIILIHDKLNAVTSLCIPIRETSNGHTNIEDEINFFKTSVCKKPEQKEPYQGSSDGFCSNFTKSVYLNAVEQIKEYIRSGDIYQANLSQRFQMDFSGDTFSLFKTLFERNPAPFFAYINAGDHQIISTSPERFLHQNQKHVETRPIKGTRPRGKTNSEDTALGRELQQSKKDDAELSMIVDLLRNDFGKVCAAGSVNVAKHKMLESYKNVFHLVSIVEGSLFEGKTSVDLIEACFPGGSITGCPKIRSMEIIDELEPTRRHIYTGSIGYISFHNTMDLSIAIRTATVYDNTIHFSVGGGIVFDSDPEDEFNETLHKGQTLMKAFTGNDTAAPKDKKYVWMNGSIKPQDEAGIPISDLGFLYGFGFFETIRVNHGNVKLLNEHIQRFNKTWKTIFPGDIPDISWDEVISQTISKNKLDQTVAAVKVIATRGDKERPPYNHWLLVTATPYEHRLVQKNKTGLDIAVFPEPRQTPLASHKTLNYLYYYLAGKWAGENGFDEAVILNPDHTLSETNTANILLIRDKTIIKPVSSHVLPGIMEAAACNLLHRMGYKITSKHITVQDCYDNYEVILTNSLIGAVPVSSINEKRLGKPIHLCEEINSEVL